MPDTKSELNDIILNKSNSNFSGFKKVLLAVASFAILLIIVVVVMSSINGGSSTNLANTILPPEPITAQEEKSDLFKPVEITSEENADEQKRLEGIANEIKQQTLPPVVTAEEHSAVTNEDIVTIDDPYEAKTEPKKVVTKKKVSHTKPIVKKEVEVAKKKTSVSKKGSWYVQVGSFARVNPHKRLIAKIKRLGYAYKQYKSSINGKKMTKLLIGPYKTYKAAQKAKPKISSEIEPAAFIYQVVQ